MLIRTLQNAYKCLIMNKKQTLSAEGLSVFVKNNVVFGCWI